MNDKGGYRTAPATPGLLITNNTFLKGEKKSDKLKSLKRKNKQNALKVSKEIY